jgi:hypothetical protein
MRKYVPAFRVPPTQKSNLVSDPDNYRGQGQFLNLLLLGIKIGIFRSGNDIKLTLHCPTASRHPESKSFLGKMIRIENDIKLGVIPSYQNWHLQKGL